MQLNLNTISFFISVALFFLLLGCRTPNIQSKQDYTKYVNPFIGTQGTGHTFPGAAYPFGLIQLSPQTGNGTWDYCSGYQYDDKEVKGFAHTHLNGTGNADMGDILVLPVVKERAKKNMSVVFSKEKEDASPGYYTTYLSKDEIKVELTATAHSGIHRYTFHKPDTYQIMLNIDNILAYSKKTDSRVKEAWFKFDSETQISGFIRSKEWVERQVYFTITLSKPYKSYTFIPEQQERVLLLDYDMTDNESIEMRVGISTVSIEGAKHNLEQETKNKTFKKIVLEAKNAWNTHLRNIEVIGDNDKKEKLYSALYRMYLQPVNIADVDGQYRGTDNKVRTASLGTYYSTFSLWDTYRATHPLYTILNPEINTSFIESMLSHFEATGLLPIWTLWGKENWAMIGNHAVTIIVDAYLKGIPIDGERAFKAIKSSLTKNIGKYDWSIYDKYGYLPKDKHGWHQTVSMTLEATFNDWCAAQLAKKLDKDKDYDFFIKRSNYWKNIFDPSTKFMRARNSDGTWDKEFTPKRANHFTEGNSWQYTWHVLHDIEGLISLMGGKSNFKQKLDRLFDPSNISHHKSLDVTGLIGQYAHGNEPSHHVIYLYNYVDAPQRAHQLIKEVQETQYLNTPDGLKGNEDCGQMGAWHIFSAMGFYPVNPASGMYDLGVPSFKYARIRVGKNNFFEIKAPKLSEKNIYVNKIYLNGKEINNYKISHKDIMKGGILKFDMATNN